MSVLPAFVNCATSVQCLPRAEESTGSPGNGVTDGYELPCGCRELSPGLLEEQQPLLFDEVSLQPLSFFVYRNTQ